MSYGPPRRRARTSQRATGRFGACSTAAALVVALAVPAASAAAQPPASASWNGRPIERPLQDGHIALVSSASFPRGWSAGAVHVGTGLRHKGGSQRVREVQKRLWRLGYRPGPIDGVFGSRTKAAVQWFQIKHGFSPNGVVGLATLMHLRARSGAGTVAEANSGGGGQERAGGTVPATQTTTAPGPPASRTQSPAHGGGGWIASAALVALALLLLLALPAALVLAALRRPIVPIVGLPVLGHPTLPKLSWPALRRPTLPKLSLPAVRRPSLPKLSLPAVRRPTLPKVALPALRRPTLPKLSLPTMPAVRRPTLPKVAMPAIPRPTLPKPALPTLPALRRPTFPKIALPAIRRPKPPALALALRRSKSPKQRRPSVPARRSGAGGPVPQPRAVAPPDRVPTIGYVRYADRAELERHTNAMRQACATRNWKLAGVLRDEQRSGSKALERPGLVQALERMSTPGRTRLVVSKLSHLSRSATDLMALFEWFARHDVELVAVDAGLDMTTPDGRRAAHALLATVARRQEQARNGARNGTVPATQVVAAGRARERGDHG